MQKKYEPPREENRDLPSTMVRAATAAIPTAGSFLVEVLSNPLQVRQSRWENVIAHGLHKLQGQFNSFRADQLSQNDAFVTALLQATSIAGRNHDPQKRKALRDAVLNVACGKAPDEDWQTMFLNWIDAFTGSHLRLLWLFSNPGKHVDLKGVMSGSSYLVVQHRLPELAKQRELCDQIWKELWARGLVDSDSLHGNAIGRGLIEKRTTVLGEQFLSFITSPIDD